MSAPHNTGVLLVNLGTPDAPTPRAVKKFLKTFLSDSRVITLWKPLWWIILNFIILRFRSKKIAALYRDIWLKEGSPLFVNTKKIAEALQEKVGNEKKIAFAMRYSAPAISAQLQIFKKLNK